MLALLALALCASPAFVFAASEYEIEWNPFYMIEDSQIFVGDSITFAYDNGQDLYQLPTADAFETCDFSDAKVCPFFPCLIFLLVCFACTSVRCVELMYEPKSQYMKNICDCYCLSRRSVEGTKVRKQSHLQNQEHFTMRAASLSIAVCANTIASAMQVVVKSSFGERKQWLNQILKHFNDS
jgi:hypothetical protein